VPWFRVDDSFHDHPKVFDAPDCAVALWTRAGTWSARNLTDGFVPATILTRFTSDPDTAARELVHRGLWLRAKGGFQFHDWHEYQPTKEAVENERKMKAERQRRWREAKRRRSSRRPVDASRNASQDGAPPPPRPEGSGAGEPAPGNGTRPRASPPGSRTRAGCYPTVAEAVAAAMPKEPK
jgi:hypothetical protein